MRNVKRHFKTGNVYFLTHVTFQRLPILVDNIDLFWASINHQLERSRFDFIAWVILPDHWHCIIDPGQDDLGDLMKRIKLSFATRHLRRTGRSSGRTWQNRYWDHIIRDQFDLNRHLDYLHYNPVKHGLVRSCIEYPHSSFARFVEEGCYDRDWMALESIADSDDFGE